MPGPAKHGASSGDKPNVALTVSILAHPLNSGSWSFFLGAMNYQAVILFCCPLSGEDCDIATSYTFGRDEYRTVVK